MKAGESKKRYKKCIFPDLNGKWIAYDTNGRPLGAVIYKKGVIVSRKKYKEPK
jgi:hypothetical protein